MRPVTVTVGPLAAASATNIAASQTPTAAGGVTLNGSTVVSGVAILDKPRRVLITNGASESTNTFTITGTNASGMAQVEVLAGSATPFFSNLNFKTVSSIALANNASGTITVGTNGVADAPWVRLDDYAFAPVMIHCYATGTVNFTVQSTLQDPNDAGNPVAPYALTWINSADSNAVAATGTIQTNYTQVPLFIRVTLNSGTGSVSSVVAQPGAVPF